ncbi:MAG: Phosphoglycolate phosphatase [Anaerolineales bacterium]|nr:Phosphoglycolate phosphatase [Anaerolineales bacterium]
MPSILRAVIFDLGGTLMFEREATRPISAQGDEALTLYLREQGLELNLSTFPLEFRKRLDSYFSQREKDLFETTYSFVLRDILGSKGYDDVSDDLIRNALDRLFAVTQTNWVLESDTLSTLKKIEADGYRMGLISNAGDDKDVQQMVQKFRISRYFDFVLTSAACSYRKPHPRIFEMALSNWYFLPSEAVMVGDNLTADVKGAKAAGLFGVWLTRRANSRPAQQADVTPDATISTLAELPSILDRLQVQ